jgi:hypothetical protein
MAVRELMVWGGHPRQSLILGCQAAPAVAGSLPPGHFYFFSFTRAARAGWRAPSPFTC